MINYINQLGRADAARLGAYKNADPGAELYYEGLRYLQGRGPAAAAAADAGFAVWSKRADPVIASCQRNAVATIGHASFVDDRFLPGNTRSGKRDAPRAPDPFAPGGAFDVAQSAARVGAMEADSSGAFRNGAPRPDLQDLANLDDGPAAPAAITSRPPHTGRIPTRSGPTRRCASTAIRWNWARRRSLAAARCTSPQNMAPSTTATATPTRSSPARAGQARANGAATAAARRLLRRARRRRRRGGRARPVRRSGRAPGRAAGPH